MLKELFLTGMWCVVVSLIMGFIDKLFDVSAQDGPLSAIYTFVGLSLFCLGISGMLLTTLFLIWAE